MRRPGPPLTEWELRELLGVDEPKSDVRRSMPADAKRLEKTVLVWTAGFLVGLLLVVIAIVWSMTHFAP